MSGIGIFTRQRNAWVCCIPWNGGELNMIVEVVNGLPDAAALERLPQILAVLPSRIQAAYAGAEDLTRNHQPTDLTVHQNGDLSLLFNLDIKSGKGGGRSTVLVDIRGDVPEEQFACTGVAPPALMTFLLAGTLMLLLWPFLYPFSLFSRKPRHQRL